jgi:hypothetical protein
MRRGLALALLLAAAACAPDHGAEEREVRTLVFTELSQPDLGVVVGPVVMQSNYAIVDWTRGAFSGGRTLLRKDKGDWNMILCGGAPLKQRPTLEAAGVPDGTAGILAAKLVTEESRLNGERRAQIDKWSGLRLDGKRVNCPEARPVPSANP